VILALRRELSDSPGAGLRALARGLGRVLLVGFAVGLTPAWGFIPLSVAGGLVFFEWLLPRKAILPAEAAETFVKSHREEGIKNLLDLNRQTRLWRAARGSAQKQARENKLDETQFEAKRKEYDNKKESLEKPDYLKGKGPTLRDLAFNLIVSLLAFDIRTLIHFDLDISALPDLYDFGELAAYLTGSGAPLVTTIVTAITNQLDQWVPALLNVVFPSFTLSDAQFQLLQLLIDLVQRIASG
jgi:hypothetical protein